MHAEAIAERIPILKSESVRFVVLFSSLLCAVMTLLRVTLMRDDAPLLTLIGIPVVFAAVVSLFVCAAILAWGAIRQHVRRLQRKSPAPMPLGSRVLASLLGLPVGIRVAQATCTYVLNCGSFAPHEAAMTLFFGSAFTVTFLSHEAYRRSQDKVRELEKATVESQFNLLKNQMQPHFLFNSLNSLSELMYQNVDAASDTTEKLSDLYRNILANSKEKTSTLASELKIIRDYLAVEQIRFGERLTYTVRAAIDTECVFVPSLMLQTLVENAVKHGISKSIGGGDIAVTIYHDSDMCSVEVRNTGAKLSESARQRATAGVGLLNTIRRLDLLYGGAHEFRLASNLDGSTSATFRITGARIG